jgi:hypothetical protein
VAADVHEAYNVRKRYIPESIIRPLDMTLVRIIEADCPISLDARSKASLAFRSTERDWMFILVKLERHGKELRTKEFLFA